MGREKGDNGRSITLGVSMGPFSPTRRDVLNTLSDRPLSRVRWAVPEHREVLPLDRDAYRKAQELRARKQPMISHKTMAERERWLLDVGAIEKPTDVELSMELYLRDKLSEIAQPVVRKNDLRGLDQPKEKNMPERVKIMRAEKAKVERERLKKSIEDHKRGEAERQEAARKEFEDLKGKREATQKEVDSQIAAKAEAEKVRALRVKKKKQFPEPARVMSPSSKEASPLSKGKSVEDISGIEKKKSPDVQQLELDLDSACKGSSSVHQVRMLLAMCPDGVLTNDVNGNTPLSVAAASGQRNLVELLLKEGSDVNHVNLRGSTPIARACAANHRDVVMLLLEYGANELTKDKNSRNALDYASERLKREIQTKKIKIVQTAVVADAMFSAVEGGDVHRLVSLFLMAENQVDADIVDKRSSLGWSLLHMACSEGGPGHLEIARLLIEQGVNVDLPDSDGDTPLHLASQGKGDVSETLVGLLLECGAHEARVNKKGRSPIFSVCIGEGSVVSARQLLAHDSYLRHTDFEGRTCLFYACYRGHEELASYLVRERGARIDVEDDGGLLPLSLCPSVAMADNLREQRRQWEREIATQSLVNACLALDETRVLSTLKEGLTSASTRRGREGNKGGETMLHCVLRGESPSLSFPELRCRQTRLIEALLAHAAGASTAGAGTAGTAGDGTAAAGTGGKAEASSEDLRHCPDEEGWTAFHLACAARATLAADTQEDRQASQTASDELLDLLYPSSSSSSSSSGASFSSPHLHTPVSSTGNTPLHLSLMASRPALALRLLRDGADARKKNTTGLTPLHMACREGLSSIVLTLLSDHGCSEDLIALDKEGKEPTDLCDGERGEAVLREIKEFQQMKAKMEAEAHREIEKAEEQERQLREIAEAKAKAEEEKRGILEKERREEEERVKVEEEERERMETEKLEQERQAHEDDERRHKAQEEFAILASSAHTGAEAEAESEKEKKGDGEGSQGALTRVSSLSNSLHSDEGHDRDQEREDRDGKEQEQELVRGSVSMATDGAVQLQLDREGGQEQGEGGVTTEELERRTEKLAGLHELHQSLKQLRTDTSSIRQADVEVVPVVVVEGVDDETMKLLTEQFAALQSDWDEDSFRNLEGSYKELMERSTKAV